MAAPAKGREREFPAPGSRATETSLNGLPRHLRDGDSTA